MLAEIAAIATASSASRATLLASRARGGGSASIKDKLLPESPRVVGLEAECAPTPRGIAIRPRTPRGPRPSALRRATTAPAPVSSVLGDKRRTDKEMQHEHRGRRALEGL